MSLLRHCYKCLINVFTSKSPASLIWVLSFSFSYKWQNIDAWHLYVQMYFGLSETNISIFVRIGSFSTLNIWGPGNSSDDDNLCEVESSNNSFDELVLLCKGRHPGHLLRTAVEVIWFIMEQIWSIQMNPCLILDLSTNSNRHWRKTLNKKKVIKTKRTCWDIEQKQQLPLQTWWSHALPRWPPRSWYLCPLTWFCIFSCPSSSIPTRAGKSKSLIRWKRRKGGKGGFGYAISLLAKQSHRKNIIF